jgi:hypothetical protein
MHGHRALRRAKPVDCSVQPPSLEMGTKQVMKPSCIGEY